MKLRSILAMSALLTIFAVPQVGAQSADQVLEDLVNQARTGSAPPAAMDGGAGGQSTGSIATDSQEDFGHTKSFDTLPSDNDLVEALMPTEATKDLKVIPRSQQRGAGIKVEFDYNSHELRGQDRAVADAIGRALRDPRLSGYRVEIQGHTDAAGDAYYNQNLSERRAAWVAAYLNYNYGVDLSRVVIRGFGESHLLDPYNPYSRRNRRVAIGIIGKS